jgi:hypothetical protein
MDQLIDQVSPILNPGAGGGGGGAVGDDARAGDGGGGGDDISTSIDLAELRKVGLDRIEFVVGKGGLGSSLPGQHGNDGEDTVMNFLAADGTVLKTLRASGGSGARSPTSYLPDGVAELSPQDVDNGFRITTLMAVNAAEFREDLLFVLGGGWDRFPVPHLPLDAVWLVICTAKWRELEGPVPRGVFLSLFHPSGREVSCQTLIIAADAIHPGRHWICPIGATFDAEGAWTLRVHSGGFLLAEIDVRVMAPH